MARLVLVIESNDSIAQLNSKLNLADGVNPPAVSTNGEEHANLIMNYLSACQAGIVDASIQVTTRDTDPSVSTSGAGSLQRVYSLK